MEPSELGDPTSNIENRVAAYLEALMPQGDEEGSPVAALVPWFCDVLL